MRVGIGPSWGDRTLIREALSKIQDAALGSLCCGQLIVKTWKIVGVGMSKGPRVSLILGLWPE